MEQVTCPRCHGRGLRIAWGMPTAELVARVEQEGDVVLGGCCVRLDITHQCAECGHRFQPERTGTPFGWMIHRTGGRELTGKAFLVTLDDCTTTHRTFTDAAQHIATRISDAVTIERCVQIIEFSEADGIILTRRWTAQMIDGEFTWTTPQPPW